MSSKKNILKTLWDDAARNEKKKKTPKNENKENMNAGKTIITSNVGNTNGRKENNLNLSQSHMFRNKTDEELLDIAMKKSLCESTSSKTLLSLLAPAETNNYNKTPPPAMRYKSDKSYG
jgi:hypothetical protein